HRIDAITLDGTSNTWQYNYSGNNLVSVTGPGGAAWRTYTYSGSLLTEARDGAGKLIESHAYDAYGQALSSVQQQNDIQSVEYEIASPVEYEHITRVHSAAGAITDYYLRFYGGRSRTVRIDGHCS